MKKQDSTSLLQCFSCCHADLTNKKTAEKEQTKLEKVVEPVIEDITL